MRLFLAATILATAVTGCSVLDKVTGVFSSDTALVDEPPIAERVAEAAEKNLPWPWGMIAGSVVGYGAAAYRNVRRKQKAGEVAS